MSDRPPQTSPNIPSEQAEISQRSVTMHKQRLDEILIQKGLISEAQIKEALQRQKANGGRFGSQLLSLGYIDETGLVDALSTQLGCQGVVLSDFNIPQSVIRTIPKELALARRVIPFQHDLDHNILKIACEDPTDLNLIRELEFIVRGKEVRMYVAAEIALNQAIARYYLRLDIAWDQNPLAEKSDAEKKICEESTKPGPDQSEITRQNVLLVTDEEKAAALLRTLLERDNFQVSITSSPDEALRLLENEKIHTVLMKESDSADLIHFVGWVHEISPKTIVRCYQTASSLLLNKGTGSVDADLLQKDLDLLTSLLSCMSKLPDNHCGRVGRYVDDLCRRLRVPDEHRQAITHAAYVHDLAKFYYNNEETKDNRLVIKLTIKLLRSLNYSPEIVKMLRLVYADLPQKHPGRLPIREFGSNIITVVDLFCHSTQQFDRLSLDKFDPIKEKLRELTGKLLSAKVVETFIDMIQEEILGPCVIQKATQVMIYAEAPSLQQTLELRLKNEGFRSISQSSPRSFAELYERSRPDIMVLAVPGEPDNIKRLVHRLTEEGISFKRTPTLLLTDSSIPRVTSLFEQGIEDIVILDDNFNLLLHKIHGLEIKISARTGMAEEIVRDGSKSEGRLADTNLVELIQALGAGRKTVRLEVRSKEQDKAALTFYMNQGQITFARLEELAGAEAIYEALTWADGTWVAEPVAEPDLPPPNNQHRNEAILTEGCRRIDQKPGIGQLQ
jgi:DNA-binding response OmpR family regulator